MVPLHPEGFFVACSAVATSLFLKRFQIPLVLCGATRLGSTSLASCLSRDKLILRYADRKDIDRHAPKT